MILAFTTWVSLICRVCSALDDVETLIRQIETGPVPSFSSVFVNTGNRGRERVGWRQLVVEARTDSYRAALDRHDIAKRNDLKRIRILRRI